MRVAIENQIGGHDIIGHHYIYDHANPEKYTMKVVRKFYQSDEKLYFDIDKATDLFEKFKKSHEVNRIHLDIESLPEEQRPVYQAKAHANQYQYCRQDQDRRCLKVMTLA